MSLEKEVTLRALGAEIVRTPTEAPSQGEESNIGEITIQRLSSTKFSAHDVDTGVARRLQRTIPGGVILDQYSNPNNPLAHEFGTGPELIHAITTLPSTSERPHSGKIDVLVAGAGTGGTVTGLSKVIKQRHNKDCVVVGVDPVCLIRGLSHFFFLSYLLVGTSNLNISNTYDFFLCFLTHLGR